MSKKIDGRKPWILPFDAPKMTHETWQSACASHSVGQGKITREQWIDEIISEIEPSFAFALAYAYIRDHEDQQSFIRLGGFSKNHYQRLYDGSIEVEKVDDTSTESSAQYKMRVERLHTIEWQDYERFAERHPKARFAEKQKESVLEWTKTEKETYDSLVKAEEGLRQTFGSLLDFGVPTKINSLEANIDLFRLKDIPFSDKKAVEKLLDTDWLYKPEQKDFGGSITYTFRHK
jgi:hypothetical protein